MLLKAYNRILTKDREKTYLTTAASAADTTLTVSDTDLAPAGTSSNTWADNDYMIVGEPGNEKTNIMQMAAAVTSATSLTIDREGSAGGLRHDHPINTPVYRILFNQVQFLHSSTNDTGTASVLATINLQPDDEFTRYEDTSNTTGYGFARFKNATTNAYSSYSDGVNYEESGDSSSRDPKTLWVMRNKVRQLLDETEPDSKISDKMIDDAINDKQREIAHIRLWSFYESERSFSSVENQFAYDLPSTVQKVHGVLFDTQPLDFITRTDWGLKHFDTDQTTQDPWAFSIWNNQVKVYPRPDSSASTTTLGAGMTASDTSMTVAATSSFNRGDYYRVIIDSEVIYATGATSTTLTGLLRGKEGTTAATHANGSTVTERDIVYPCHVEPDSLYDNQSRTTIPEPEILTYGTAIDLAPLCGKEDFIQIWEMKYNLRIKDLKDKYSSKETAQHGRIKDISERLSSQGMLNNPNSFPRSINT
jgi:hypothetical protein